MAVLVSLACLSSIVMSSNVICHLQTKYSPGSAFTLSPAEILVKTIYGVNLIVDAVDPYVSRIIRQTGTWEP